ncbi:MAG: hypothetical protein ACXV2C_05175 [Candidatus Bathyarchaeia archaeon]
MENKSQIKKNKFLTVAVLTLFLLSATAISSASAQIDPTRIPDSTSTDNGGGLISENPTLYTAQDDSTAAPDDNSSLGRVQDNSTALPDDNATLYTTQDSLNDENAPLIAPAPQPDNTLTILGIALLATVIAVSAVVAVNYPKKN